MIHKQLQFGYKSSVPEIVKKNLLLEMGTYNCKYKVFQNRKNIQGVILNIRDLYVL